MAIDLKGKKILITGSTDGLGKRLAVELSKDGAHIILHGRSKEKAEKVLPELFGKDHSVVVCDFENPTKVIEEMSQVKELDILINNVGMWQEGNTVDVVPENVIKLVNTNLTGAIVTTRVLLPLLMMNEFSQILNVSSIGGVEIPQTYSHTVYSAVKWGLQGFSEGLAKEFDGKNIRVMGYYPGGMATNFFKKVGMDYKVNEPWMFDTIESVEAIIFMLTRNPKVNVKRMDLINHLQE